MVQLSHPYMTTGKTIPLTRCTIAGKVMLFNMLSRFVIAFLLRSKCLLISWLQSPPAVILESKKINVCHCFHCFTIYLPWSDWDRMPWSSFFKCWVLSQLFHSPLSLSSRGSSIPLHLTAVRVVSSAYLRLLIFLPATLTSACASSSLAFAWCTLHISLISRVTIYSLNVILSQFGTSPLFCVQF